MGTAAKQVAVAPLPDEIVNIVNGVPNKNPASIPNGGVIQFNADSNEYLIELFDKKNQNHPAICVFLDANASITLIGGPTKNDIDCKVPYNVIAYAGMKRKKVASGGGKTIIIGSGLADSKDKAKRKAKKR